MSDPGSSCRPKQGQSRTRAISITMKAQLATNGGTSVIFEKTVVKLPV